MKTAFLAVGLAALLAAPALADVVTLTDGSKREGKVIREDDKFVTLEIVQGRMRGEMVFNREKIKSIEKGPTAAEKLQAEVEQRRAALKDGDAAGWVELARWLEGQNGYSADARAAWEKVIAADPDNATAREKLGYQKVGGQWLSEAEIMAAKGLVSYRGMWITPEDKKKAEATDRQVYEDVKIELADDAASARAKKAAEEARRLADWRRQMEAVAAERAAEVSPDTMLVASGGVIYGPYGYGYYGVRTSPGGQYIPFIPANSGQVIYYTGVGGCPVIVNQHSSSSSSSSNFGVTYTSKHWKIHWGSQ